MYNWSTDEKSLAQNPRDYAIWQLEQQINFGLGFEGKKISSHTLLEFWSELEIDPDRRRFFELLINGNTHSKSNSLTRVVGK